MMIDIQPKVPRSAGKGAAHVVCPECGNETARVNETHNGKLSGSCGSCKECFVMSYGDAEFKGFFGDAGPGRIVIQR